MDSASWPCDLTAAKNVRLRAASLAGKPIESPFTLKPNVLVAEAELRPSEIQDLADQLSELRQIAGAVDLRFRVRLELDGRAGSVNQDSVSELNTLLAKISKALSFK